jgi:hypothetical protein
MQFRIEVLNKDSGEWGHLVVDGSGRDISVFPSQGAAQAVVRRLIKDPRMDFVAKYRVDSLDIAAKAEGFLAGRYDLTDDEFPLIKESETRWEAVELMNPITSDKLTVAYERLKDVAHSSKTLNDFWNHLPRAAKSASNPCQREIVGRANRIAEKIAAKKKPAADSGPAVLWEYTDDEGNVFYLTEKHTTAKSPFTGKPVKGKPSKTLPAQMGAKLKEKKAGLEDE